MRSFTVLAGGTSALALAAALTIGAAQAFAQSPYGTYGSNTNPPQYSTPAEQEQTRELNEQSVNGTTQSPAVLNGETQNYSAGQPQQSPAYANSPQGDSGSGNQPADTSGYGNPPTDNYGGQPPAATGQPSPSAGPQQRYYDNPQSAPPYGPPQQPAGGPQAQYQGQLDQYGEQQDEYQRQREQYQSERNQYRADLRAYDRAMYDWAYPAPITYRYDGSLEPLYLVAEPSQQLFQIPVEDPSGRWVGRVRNVEIAPDGRPSRVEVSLNRRVSVWVQPADMRYDPGARVLFTDLSRGQLWQLPGATVESGPM